jgi:23S rRNA pseudouridine2605 synthase/23S rRNA pseudouridine2604 synthase
MILRLQKFLAHAGICSRRKAEVHILNGRVRINGQVVYELGTKIDTDTDEVLFDNQIVKNTFDRQFVYIALNKPAGYVTSCSQENASIIMELIDIEQRVYPVGRLDKDSEGLVLLTNDGELHNKLSHPSFDHEKEYLVETLHPISDKDLQAMARGMMIDGQKTRKAMVKRLSKNKINMVLKQGLNRQIRKMVGKTGNQVVSLKRIRVANIKLADLKKGAWRYLRLDEIARLTQ